MKILSFIICSLFLSSIFALNEVEYQKLVNELIAIKSKTTTTTGIVVDIKSFKGTKNKDVAYTRFEMGDGESGSIVISVGRAESSISYYEVAKDFLKRGYSPLYILDHRGQGFSERLLRNKQKGHIDKFDNYGEDFSIFLNDIVSKDILIKDLYLIAHSMGATVSANAMLKNKFKFKAVAYTSPMFKLSLPKSEEETLVDLNSYCFFLGKWTGACKKYIPGGGDFNPNDSFLKNRLTSDPNRFKLIYKPYSLWPVTQLGSATLNWVKESILATQKIRRNANRLNNVTLILQAGKDTIIDNKGHFEYCSRALDCRIEELPQSKHGILSEREEIRSKAISMIDDFFKAQ